MTFVAQNIDAKNRRIEIILTARLEEIAEMLKEVN